MEEYIVGAKIDNFLFDFNRAEIRDEFKAELDELGGFLNKNPKAYAVLAGFIDNIGSREHNLGLGLSETRASFLFRFYKRDRDIMFRVL